jgi:hypothetical protein
VAFDEPNLIADAGLAPMVTLAERIGVPGFVPSHDRPRPAAEKPSDTPAVAWWDQPMPIKFDLSPWLVAGDKPPPLFDPGPDL